MYPIKFSKARAEEILAAINSGDAIPAPSAGWNKYEMLQVAGACFFGLLSQGPPTYRDLANYEKLPAEHREAVSETLTEDIHDAIEFYNQLSMMIVDGQYDTNCEPEVHAVVMREDERPTVNFLKGAKRA